MLTILPLVVLSALAQPPTAPSFEWQTAEPASQGMSAERLESLRASLAEHKSKALVVIRNDRIVMEWYAEGHAATKTHYTASMAKALVGGMAVAVALNGGRIKLDDPAGKFIPAWRGDERKATITIAQLGSHTSGLDDAHQDGVPHEKLPGWMGEFWKRQPPPGDPFTISRDQTPLVFDPGEKFHYSNPGIAMLGYAATAAIQDGPHKDLRSLLRERVMRPIGAPDSEWSVGYGQTPEVNGLPLVAAWGGGGYTARTAARVGRLMLREGNWEGRQLISREAVRATTTDAGTPGPCGIGWWTNTEGAIAGFPRDAFWAAGAGDQILLVVPSLRLIAVRNGAALPALPSEKGQHQPAARRLLFLPLIGCVVDREGEAPAEPPADRHGGRSLQGVSPYSPSPVFKSVTWAPVDSIVRLAKGSDNWPLTWADDGHQYGAYGDGWGFQRAGMPKLSLGLARIEGDADAPRGFNVRSATLEQVGDGAKGRKASGLVMIDCVLYLWARNAGNSQLAWSADRGKTWTWSDWRFTTSFGCPAALNFGRDYAGARDEFVYVYSHDADSAYKPADRMVLARVPTDKLREREAYEFFAGLTGGQPAWSRDVERRAAVFTHAGQCYRSSVTYHAPTKRYLWCQVLPGDASDPDTRFRGGLGIFDAPEPWGPWTTVYFSREWDVGPGESCSFPTKWMKEDGRTLHLVFSGDDQFSVRKLTVELADDQKP